VGQVSHATPPLGVDHLSSVRYGLVIINVCAKFKVPIFIRHGSTKYNAKSTKYGYSGGYKLPKVIDNVTIR